MNAAAICEAPAAVVDIDQGEARLQSQFTATYSPEDNKLRLYSVRRLDAELYARVREAGFIWAPKQELFVAPMWTPGRADLLLELCGEIGDEDNSLVDRAAERAERFEDYSDSRIRDACAARDSVEAIAGAIPFGQPILVGHHSERRARKDAEKIENGMRRAVNMWDTADYWQRRAAGALHHAKYKALPAVRARRIKGLDSDKRKQEKLLDDAQTCLAFWSREDLTHDQAVDFAGRSSSTLYLARKEGDREDFNQSPSAYSALTGSYPNLYAPRTLAEVVDAAKRVYPRSIAKHKRWIQHYEHRIGYERAMLAEQGGLVADSVDMVPGGRVLVRGEWSTIVRVNKKGGKVVSVTTNARFVSVRQVEDIKEYTPPAADVAAAVAKATKLPPLVNYPGEGFLSMTKAEWKATHADYKGSRELGAGAVRPGGSRPDVKCDKAENFGRHRVRTVVRGGLQPVFLTDEKRKDPPPVNAAPVAAPVPIPAAAPADEPRRSVQTPAVPDAFDAMREQLRHGVQAVSADQLFPTPAALADRMVELAELAPGMRVLDPEAGTGAILAAVRRDGGDAVACVGVEVNANLAKHLENMPLGAEIHHSDFLECGDELGLFHAILMNPPFAQAQDIEHILAAKKFMRRGGVLVAICANGPRQNEVLRPMIEQNNGHWEILPPGTFKESGTMVNAVLMVYRFHV